jgi:hypothetical protein
MYSIEDVSNWSRQYDLEGKGLLGLSSLFSLCSIPPLYYLPTMVPAVF